MLSLCMFININTKQSPVPRCEGDRRIFLWERIRSGTKGDGLLNPCCIWTATAFYQIVLLGKGVLGAHPLNPPDLKHDLTAIPSSSSDSCKQTYLPTKSGHQICAPKSCSVSGLGGVATPWLGLAWLLCTGSGGQLPPSPLLLRAPHGATGRVPQEGNAVGSGTWSLSYLPAHAAHWG